MIKEILEKRRNELGLTQEEVANQAKITRPYYSLIESETKRPSPEVAQRIANIYGIDWTVFYV